MVRSKVKSATISKIQTQFKTRNQFGRDGCRRTKIRWKVPSFERYWRIASHELRQRIDCGELYQRIAHYIKTSKHPLITTASQNVLEEASWSDTSRITNLIHKYLPQIKVEEVKKVNNPYIAAMYELKKEEYRSRYRSEHNNQIDPLQELELFHSTGRSNVDTIVKENLNWRYVRRSKFGLGTCFSSDADYANCHANRSNGESRAFIVCKVLVRDKTLGSWGLDRPPQGMDTTTGGRTNEIIYVKYSDNEFLPQFVAYYKCDKSKDVFGSKYNNMPRNWF